MNPRHNTGRIIIGLAYTPRLTQVEGDAIRIQSALLEPRSATPQSLFQRVAGTIWSWL